MMNILNRSITVSKALLIQQKLILILLAFSFTAYSSMTVSERAGSTDISHLDRGIMLMFQGQTAAGIEELEQAIALGTNQPEAYYYLSMGYSEKELWNGVVDTTDQMLKLLIDDIEALYAKGRAHFNLGQWESASKALKQVVNQDPFHVRAQKTLGKTQIKRQDFAGAIESLTSASELNPTSTIIWYNLGMAYLNQREYKTATECFEKSIQLAPSFPQPHYGLGTALLRSGKREDGQKSMAQFQHLQKMTAEHERLSRLTQENSEDITAWSSLAHLSMEAQNYPFAVRAFEQCVSLEPKNATHRLGLSRAFMELGLLVPARESLFKAIEIQPDEPILYNTLGSTYAMQGQIQQAIVAFQRAVNLNPSEPYYHLNLGKLHQQMGDQKTAEYHFSAYKELKNVTSGGDPK